MCSAPINRRPLTQPLSQESSLRHPVLALRDLRSIIFRFLPLSDLHTAQRVCKSLKNPTLLNTCVDMRERALNFNTLKSFSTQHKPTGYRVKLSADWNDDLLNERLK